MEKFSDLIYVRPDVEALSRRVEEYAAAVARAGSCQEARRLLLDHEADMASYATMQSVAHIRNTVDTRDPFYEEEAAFFDREGPRLALLQRRANEALLASPYRAQLEREFSPLYFQNLETQKQFADERVVDAQIREGQLRQRYSKISATASIDFRGEPCNFYRLLKYMQSTDRALRREAFQAWADLYQRIAPELDAVYDEMVPLRHGMAKQLGFASYTDMAYLQRRRYDYTAADTARFRRQVREIITPACARLYERQAQRLGVDRLHYYDEFLSSPSGNPQPRGSREELVAKAQQMYREMSPETGAFFDCMVEHDLFDLESKPGKRPGGYCTSLPTYKVPFIFSNFNGTSADVDVLTHEAGHAFENYTASRLHPLRAMVTSTSEINEIHSMTMEHFAYPWMELFFGEEADQYRRTHLTEALTVVPYMACVDEFQHRVYAAPEMTALERRAVWRELERAYMPWRDYDGNAFLEGGGFWMQKQHIFLYPFYYIEYALAQMGAFQFYGRMKEDRGQAWADYCRLCRAGGSRGYFQLLELAGLSNPFQPGSVGKAVSGVLEELGV